MVFDENLKEVGRFVEVEVNKKKVTVLEEMEEGLAMAELRKGEMPLASLGITPQHRLKKSLYEMFKR